MITQPNDGGPAFPTPGETNANGDVVCYPSHGMSLRDWFAGQALAGELAAQNEFTGAYANNVGNDPLSARAQMLYRFADAMLSAREKGAK